MEDPASAALAAIDEAMALTGQRLQEDPEYFVYRTARDELEAMRRSLEVSGAPDRVLQGRLTIGWLAVRELDGSDPEYESALKKAVYIYGQLT